MEKKVAEGVFDAIRKWFKRRKDDEKQIESLKAQLAEEKSGRLAFERKLAEFECHPEDDNIYWKKDGSGLGICPLCINGPEKLFTPLTHGANEGSYYCRLHDHFFETQECRNRVIPSSSWLLILFRQVGQRRQRLFRPARPMAARLRSMKDRVAEFLSGLQQAKWISALSRHWVHRWLATAFQRGGVVGSELRFEQFSQVVCWLRHA